MKRLKIAVLLLFVSVGYTYAQDITVQGETKVNTDFRKYKTFGWLQDSDHGPIYAYTYRAFEPTTTGDVIVYSYSGIIPSADSLVNHTVRRAVDSELEGRGYKKASINPDLLVTYRVFDRNTAIKGYNNDTPAKVGSQEVRQPEDTVTYRLEPGTLLISLIDAKTGQAIWEGFASGLASNGDIIDDKTKVKEATNLIFGKYKYRADKFTADTK
jgi:hypothetical protein